MTRTRQPNPIFERALQHSRWPSLKATLFFFWLFVMAGVIYSVSLDYVFQRPNFRINKITFNVAMSYSLFSFLIAIFSAPISASITGRYLANAVKTSHFQAVRLTDLPRRRIVSGYLLAALFRLRVLWAFIYGMLFVLPIVMESDHTEVWAVLEVSTACWLVCVSLNWLAVCAGLWASIHRAEKDDAVYAALRITWAAVLASFCGSVIPVYGKGGQLWWLIIPIPIFVTSIALSVVLLHQAEQHI
jgi:hypothetical protein